MGSVVRVVTGKWSESFEGAGSGGGRGGRETLVKGR